MTKKQDTTPEVMYNRIMIVAELLANSMKAKDSNDTRMTVKKPQKSKI